MDVPSDESQNETRLEQVFSALSARVNTEISTYWARNNLLLALNVGLLALGFDHEHNGSTPALLATFGVTTTFLWLLPLPGSRPAPSRCSSLHFKAAHLACTRTHSTTSASFGLSLYLAPQLKHSASVTSFPCRMRLLIGSLHLLQIADENVPNVMFQCGDANTLLLLELFPRIVCGAFPAPDLSGQAAA